jgi:hypothetical protein
LQLESLESRALLAGDLLISEFLADNGGSLLDQDGDASDWIELHNPTGEPVDLSGWHLTDDLNEPDKWTFPSLMLNAGGFLTVFASGKDRTSATAELHTNFNLSSDGEYLALVRPDLEAEHAYAPTYPAQQTDVSYGVLFDGLPLVTRGSQSEIHVPESDALGANWVSPDYVIDEEAWSDANLGVGFGLSVPGFHVGYYKASGQISSLAQAESLISSMQPTATEISPVVNYFNTGSTANYAGDRPFPTQTINVDVEDFVIEATGQVVIPAAGAYTFGVNSDDGFGLTITEGATTHAVSYPEPRGPADTLQTFVFSNPGTYPLRLVFYERGGGAEVELFAARGAYTSWNATNFDLVGDTASGGLAVSTSGNGTAGVGGEIQTDIESVMRSRNASVYLRAPFLVNNISELDSLALTMKYNDGFVAYLNGIEVARRNAPAVLNWNSAATAARSDTESGVAEVINLTSALPHLRQGLNILAFHGLNATIGNSSFLLSPQLSGGGIVSSDPKFFADPTPGTINSASSFGIVADTRFSVDRGFYDAPFDVAITTATEDATIRYTIDGSAPTATTGTVYSGPIHVSRTTTLRAAAFKPGFEPTDVDTHTYVFVDNVLTQGSTIAGFPSTWGSAAADYEMDPEILNHPVHGSTMRDDLKSLPVMSITMNVNDLFGTSGIYSNSTNQGVAWERAASLEYFDPDGGDDFQINAGLRMYGGVGRDAQFKKHSFRVLFKDDYGDTKLRFPLFGEDAADRFDTIILRSNFNDAWVWGGSSSQYIRDEFMAQSQLAMGEPGRHGTFVHLYINGLYWGLYNPVERPDPAFSATYLGGDKDNWDGINSGAPTGESQTAGWNTLMNMSPTLGENSGYQQVQGNNLDGSDNPSLESYLDIDNYITYLLVNFYGGNNDWATHNWYAGRERGPNSEGFQSYSWDAEWTLDLNSGLNENTVSDTTTSNYLLKPYTYLRNNAEFRLRFADLAHKHLFNSGALTPESTSARYRALAEEVEAAIRAESARWGDVVQATPFTQQHWVQQRDYLYNTYFPQRSNILLNQLRSAGLYPNITAPSFRIDGTSQHGGTVQQGAVLTLEAPVGTIYYTLDGTDPRELYGAISATSLTYSEPIPLNEAVQVKSRVLSNGTWSALNETIYTLDTPPPLRITEIMYNPAPADLSAGELDVDNDRYEYIELQNVGSQVLDVAQLRLVEGIDFDFSTGSTTAIAPQQRVLIVRDTAAFESRYGTGHSILGEFANDTALNNGGETLRLESTLGQVFHNFSFSDGWYSHSDGEGFSLTIRDAAGELALWNESDGWRASASRNGSPGGVDSLLDPSTVVVNELLANSAPTSGDWIELRNLSDSAVDIGNWFLSDDTSNLTKFQIPAGTLIPAHGYLVLNAIDTFGNASHPGTSIPFGFSSLGDEVILSSLDGTTGMAGGYRELVRFAGSDFATSFGRYVNAANYVDWTATSSSTPGASNTLPLVPSVVINELMYHPASPLDDEWEFVELRNQSTGTIALYDPAHPENTWRFTNGIDYQFPAGITLGPHEHLLVVSIDPEIYRARRGLDASIRIIGPYSGSLDNAGELIELSRPGAPELDGTVPYIVNERVRYNDRSPWPVTPDGTGPSLSRADATSWGNDPASWNAGTNTGTPGTENLFTDGSPPTKPTRLSARLNQTGLFELTWASAIDLQSGIGLYHIFRDGLEIGTSTTTTFVDPAIDFTAERTYQVSADNGDGVPGPLSDPFSTEVIAFQDGTSPAGSYNGTRDTELRQGSATTNYGTDTNLEIDGDDGGSDIWVMLRWDVSQIPTDANLLGASISVNVSNTTDGSYELYEMKRDWVENEATWQEYRAGQAWQTAGGQGASDRGSEPLGTLSFSSTGVQTTSLNAAGMTLLRDWISGAKPNYGFLVGNTSTTNGMDFGSREVTSASDRPKLSITYFTPEPTEPLGCEAIDQLVAEIVRGGNDPAQDYDGNGVVNRADITTWLAIAGAQNLPGGRAYQPGDANLDGAVDAEDFDIWQSHRFTNVTGWCAADFNADGVADAKDFNTWNRYKFSAPAPAVPAATGRTPKQAAPDVTRFAAIDQFFADVP